MGRERDIFIERKEKKVERKCHREHFAIDGNQFSMDEQI